MELLKNAATGLQRAKSFVNDFKSTVGNFTNTVNNVKSIAMNNVKKQATIDKEDAIYLQASLESYKPDNERSDTIGEYSYHKELSNHIVSVYTKGDSGAIITFRGTASVSEAKQSWGFIGQSEDKYATTNHHQQIRQHSDEVIAKLESSGIKFDEMVFTGHSKGGTDAIIAESKVPGSRAVVFNPGQGLKSSISAEAKKNIRQLKRHQQQRSRRQQLKIRHQQQPQLKSSLQYQRH